MYGSPISTTRAMKNEKDEKVVVFFFLAALRSQLTVIVLVSYTDSSCSFFLVALRPQLTVIVLVSSVTSLLHISKVFFLI